jgi:hypothetical protein
MLSGNLRTVLQTTSKKVIPRSYKNQVGHSSTILLAITEIHPAAGGSDVG